MKNIKTIGNKIISKGAIPSGVEDLMRVYKRFQEANNMTERYLDFISPKTHQFTSNQSFIESK